MHVENKRKCSLEPTIHGYRNNDVFSTGCHAIKNCFVILVRNVLVTLKEQKNTQFQGNKVPYEQTNITTIETCEPSQEFRRNIWLLPILLRRLILSVNDVGLIYSFSSTN